MEYTLSCMWPDGPKGRSGEAIHRNFYKYTGILRIEIFRASLVVSVQSVQSLSPSLCDPMNCSTPGLPVHQQLLEFTQTTSTESVMPSNHLILCHPLLLPPSVFPSIRVFSNESVLRISWPKWSFSFNISPSNEHSRVISFRMDWFDLLAGQRTLKSLLQNSSSKASILWPQSSLLSNSRIRT